MNKPKNTRPAADIISVLKKKGFELFPEKNHHQYYYLLDENGKKTNIYTYFSNGNKKTCDDYLLLEIKKQLKFKVRNDFENFLNYPMSYEMYLEMLKKDDEL